MEIYFTKKINKRKLVKLIKKGKKGNCHITITGARLENLDCSNMDLSFFTFHCCSIKDTSFEKTNLHYTIFSNSTLVNVNFSQADMEHCCFSLSTIWSTCFNSANLYKSSFCLSLIQDVDFSFANLSKADIENSQISWRYNENGTVKLDSCFFNANLENMNLKNSFIASGTGFSKESDFPYIPMACPEEGEFIGWKSAQGYIIKLRIPDDAKRLSGYNRHCKCSKAIVEEIYNQDGTVADIREVASNFDNSFIYKVGQLVEAPFYKENRYDMLSAGIHFYMNRKEVLEELKRKNK